MKVHKIVKWTLYSTTFFTSGGAVDKIGEIIVNRTIYQECQLDMHSIQCQRSTYIPGIVNEFVQYF